MTWTEEEVAWLRNAVATHGNNWSAIMKHGAPAHATRGSVRLRWLRMLRAPAPTEEEAAACAVPAAPIQLERGVRVPWRAAPKQKRSRNGGRPWDYYALATRNPPSRRPSPRQAVLLRRWCLLEQHGPLMI